MSLLLKGLLAVEPLSTHQRRVGVGMCQVDRGLGPVEHLERFFYLNKIFGETHGMTAASHGRGEKNDRLFRDGERIQ